LCTEQAKGNDLEEGWTFPDVEGANRRRSDKLCQAA
jgi:hypothetical protein